MLLSETKGIEAALLNQHGHLTLRAAQKIGCLSQLIETSVIRLRYGNRAEGCRILRDRLAEG